MTLPVINAIWIGDKMGPIHAACLKSFVVTGHEVVLHTYGEVSDAPHGVQYADANRLRPEDKLLRYPNGSYSLSSNLMRYEMLRQGLGLYVDCDVFCLTPMEDAETIFGREDDGYINGAVLKLPPDSPMLADLCRIDEAWVPPWSRWAKGWEGPIPTLGNMSWGTTGPRAITHYANKHGLQDLAAPREVFYPVHYTQLDWLLDTDRSLDDIVFDPTRCVHLYSNMLREILPEPIPPASPLGRMMAMVA
jgi:hypothetical protein